MACSPDDFRDQARELVADWPPLTADQLAHLGALLTDQTSAQDPERQRESA